MSKAKAKVIIFILFCTVFVYVCIPWSLPDSPADYHSHEHFHDDHYQENMDLLKQLAEDADDTSSGTKNLFKMPKQYLSMENEASPIRVLCLILTQPKELRPRAQAVFDTWGSRCTYLYFLSTKSNLPEYGLPVIHNPKEESYQNLWSKTKFGFKFAYDNLLNQVDWVFKADDDTYAIMENMHNLLARYDPEEPTFFGAHYGIAAKGGYMSGGSGYVLSRKAVEMVVPAFEDPTICRVGDSGPEDLLMGRCLGNLGIPPAESRDNIRGEETFFPLHIWNLLAMTKDWWYYKNKSKSRPLKFGYACCSEYPIAFHYIQPSLMYEMEYFFYKLKIADVKTIKETHQKRMEGK